MFLFSVFWLFGLGIVAFVISHLAGELCFGVWLLVWVVGWFVICRKFWWVKVFGSTGRLGCSCLAVDSLGHHTQCPSATRIG